MNTPFSNRLVSIINISATFCSALCAFVSFGLVTAAHAQDQTVNGNLGVSGILDVNGDNFNLGTSTYDTTKYGFSVGYAEDNTTHAATLTLTATRPTATWLWQQAAPNNGTGSSPKMSLSVGNALTLYDRTVPTPNAAIVLDPLGTSSFATSVTFNGTDNEMPNQTIIGNASVLTVGLADARYGFVASGSSVAFGPGATANSNTASAFGQAANASGPGATAIGENAGASGFLATALGTASRATGEFAIAIGHVATSNGFNAITMGVSTSASGDNSIAVGTYASANGNSAVALGTGAVASGPGTSALGILSQATGVYTSALGYASLATGYESMSLGVGSGAAGDGSASLGYHSAAPGTGAAAVGNYSAASGNYATALSTASVASGDYSVAVGRTEATSIYQTTVGAYGLPGGDANNWVATDDLFTVGNGQSAAAPSNAFSVKKNGDAVVARNLTVQGAIIVPQQGDLSMGEFTATPSPTP